VVLQPCQWPIFAWDLFDLDQPYAKIGLHPFRFDLEELGKIFLLSYKLRSVFWGLYISSESSFFLWDIRGIKSSGCSISTNLFEEKEKYDLYHHNQGSPPKFSKNGSCYYIFVCKLYYCNEIPLRSIFFICYEMAF